ncbi:MAG: hypothetical protein LH472_09490 [Pyrinomonadaceae bacterium]|nr:hypothetical protein [Pyrinomonadaceae bacterium]
MAITNTIEHLTIDLTPDVKTALEHKAKGKDIKQYVQNLVQKQALRPALEEALAPVRQEFAESGMSEDELDVFMNSVREKAHQDRQSK